jgi:anti-anti-sigma factor
MAVKIRTAGGVIVLEPEGELTTHNGAGELSNKVKDLISLGQDKILLNLNSVEYADAGGIEALLALYDGAAQSGGRLRFSNPTGEIHYLLSMTKLSMESDVYSDERKAVASFG